MNAVKALLKNWLPPAILRAAGELRGKGIRFEGNYDNWETATALCTGYDAESILAKVREATLKVKNGEASFERDSVLFDEIQYSWPVTAALMWVAVKNGGELHVLDFGGSLGSGYFQNRKFLSHLNKISWSVVEQQKFVDIGNTEIASDALRFYSNIDYFQPNNKPNVVLMSGVLQYLNDPLTILTNIAQRGIDTIIIDRTPFSNNSEKKIKIQHTPSEIYAATYPCWFLSRDELIYKMNSLHYAMMARFDALDDLSSEATWQGFIFEKVT